MPTGASSGAANSNVRLCWIVKGTGNVPHVAIHWATSSQASNADRTFSAYAAGAAYPNNTAALDRNGYDLDPAGTQFCADARLPASGAIYVVGHALDSGVGKISDEKVVNVA